MGRKIKLIVARRELKKAKQTERDGGWRLEVDAYGKEGRRKKRGGGQALPKVDGI